MASSEGADCKIPALTKAEPTDGHPKPQVEKRKCLKNHKFVVICSPNPSCFGEAEFRRSSCYESKGILLTRTDPHLLVFPAMRERLCIHIPFNVYSASAISAARRYVTIVEAQLSQAYAEDRTAALEKYHSHTTRDESDFETFVGTVDRSYEDDFRPILRLSSVVYLYMVFETYVSRHAAEIHAFRGENDKTLERLKEKNKCGLVKAAQIYFTDHAKLIFFTEAQWTQLLEIEHTRHCIVHCAGIPCKTKYRDSIYALESREWQGQLVGLQIDRVQGRDIGQPMLLQQRFLEYCLSILELFFHSLGAAAEARFRK